MTDEEAVAALTQLPASTRITAARLQPGDVVVIEADCKITRASIDVIKASLSKVWPGHQILVLDGTLKLKIAGGSAAGEDDDVATYRDGIQAERCTACHRVVRDASGAPMFPVLLSDIEAIACFLDTIDVAAVWGATIKRLEQTAGRTVRQMKAVEGSE